MQRRTLIFLALAAVVVAALVLYRSQVNQPTEPPVVDRDERAAVGAEQNERNSGSEAKPREVKAPASSPKKRWARRLKNADARRELLRLIARARTTRRTTRQNTQQNTQSVQDDAPRGRLDKKYIKSVIDEAAPLVKECYELALRDNPDLSARLVLEFTITGEPEVGGIVEQVQIPTDGGTAHQGTLPECLKETVLSLEFPEPEDGGKVVVRYPFSFRPK